MNPLIPNVVEKHNVQISGVGSKVLVFAHGLGLDQNIWRRVAPAFERDYKVVLFDYVGSGKAEKLLINSGKYNTLEGYADDINQIWQGLELRNITFIGHSISSMIGLIASLKKPDFYDRFIFVAPSPRYLDDVDGYIGGYKQSDIAQIIKQIEDDYAAWIESSVPSMVNESNPSKAVKEVVSLFMANDKDALKQFALASFFIDYRKALLDFKKPSLILQTTDDLVMPVQVGDYLHAHLTNSKLVTLKGKGHFPQITAPGEVIKAISRFLDDEIT